MKHLFIVIIIQTISFQNQAISQTDSIKVSAIIQKIESLENNPQQRLTYVSQIDHLYLEGYAPQLFKYVKREYDNSKNLPSNSLKFDIYHLMEATYYTFSEFDKASVIAYDLLKIAKNTKDSVHYYFAYSSIAADETELGNENAEIEFLFLAKKYAACDLGLMAKANIELGIAFLDQQELELAKQYFFKSIEIAKKASNKTQLVYAYAELMDYYYEINEFDNALHYFELVDSMVTASNELDATRDIFQSTITAAKICIKQGQFAQADKYINIVNKYATTANDKGILSMVYELWSELEEKRGCFAKSLSHFKQYKQLENEIINKASITQLNNLKISYELEKKEMEIETSRKNESFAKKQFWYIFFIAIISFIVLIVIILLLRFKLKNTTILARLNKEKNKVREIEIESLEKEIELKNKELANIFLYQYEKAKLINDVIENVDQSNKNLKHLISEQQNKNNDWDNFKSHFDKVHEGFFDKLNQLSSELTSKDIRFCAYIRMNLSSKEIAIMLGISHRTVEGIRGRVRKKLSLSSGQDLVIYLMNL